MEPPDDYRPDPPSGISYADFRAARARFQAALRADAEIRRLERAFGLPAADAPAERAAGGPP